MTPDEAVETAQKTATEAVETAQRKAEEETLPEEVAVERGRGPLVAAVGGVAGFGLIFLLVRAQRTGAFDVAVMRRLQAVPSAGFRRLMAAASWPGFPPQSRLIAPSLSGLMVLIGFRLEALFQLLAGGTGLVAAITKLIMKRPRPTHPDIRVVVAPLHGSSFPSGHVITYVGTYGFLAYLFHTLVRPVAIRRAVVGFLAGLLALVGPSRIQQGHHWPSDVIASYFLGLSYLIGLTSVYRSLKARRARQ